MIKLRYLLLLSIMWAFNTWGLAQEIELADTTKPLISVHDQTEDFKPDTLDIEETSPLDISNDRGLFLLAPDGKMQLRILGSIRFSALYDMVEMPIKTSFNTYYIPTGDDKVRLPNYYNTLNESRLGFEVKRLVGKSIVFGRLEMDFNGVGGQFRIRHAYGQVGSLLFGQTWSLFSNVASMPATVDGNGPTGSVILRNPQIRYRIRLFKNLELAAALEYSIPDLNTQEYDTLSLEVIQMIPDFTTRVKYAGSFGDIQFSTVLNTISLKNQNNEISNLFGFGGSLSGVFDLQNKQNIKYQVTAGKSITHYITTLDGTGLAGAYNPGNGEYESLWSISGFISYGWDFSEELTSSVSMGAAQVFNKPYQIDKAYSHSASISLDAFYEIIDGARIGFEYAYGQRWDKNGEKGFGSRFWTLFYYDF